eukprot:NODE_60_length_27201_cov_1.043318.p22 type:complete len:123 gc:universal NODE_60_length_27201_cov_1.043318:12746-13114(+)
MESEEAILQANRERNSSQSPYTSNISIPDMPREIADQQVTRAHMHNDFKFFKWSVSENRPDNLQYFASYVLIPQLHLEQEMTTDALVPLEKLRAALEPSLRCPFDPCKSGSYCGFQHELENI